LKYAREFMLAVVLIAGSGASAALPAAPQDLVRTRVAGLRELGAAFKNVNDEFKSDTPQIYVIQLSARQIRDAARAQYGWFPAGSGPQPDVKTAAKPEIWTQAAQFKTAQDNFATEAGSFMTIAAAGNIDAIRAQTKLLGATCGGCHRTFRVDEKH
jgi:cytochrome c556